MTGPPRETAAGAIRFERVYDAPIEDIWAMWTTRDGLEAWFAPEGMRLEILALEFKVGGAFDHVLTAVRAEEIAFIARLNRSPETRVSGQFVEIVPHQRLRLRFDIDFVPGVEPYPYDMLVELIPEAGQVRMIVTADRHPDPEMTRGAVLGLNSQLHRFDLALAERGPQEKRP